MWRPAASAEVRAAAPFALVLQYPATAGAVRDPRPELAAVQAAGGLAIVATDLLACAALTPPGELGADVVVGSAQRFGVPMGFGGPHAGFLATREAYRRAMPGRLVGVSLDAAGAPALRLALQTREQHIRREKATSNICTAQVLLAVMAGAYAVWHGPDGLRRIAHRVNLLARLLAGAALRAGLRLRHDAYFDTVGIEAGARADPIMAAALAAGFNLRRLDATGIAIAMDETVTREDLDALCEVLGAPAQDAPASIPAALQRSSAFLQAPVFSAHHSEHAMLRYLKRLEDRDVALNRGMIPLGSCTMKLNATAEMMPITWPEFADVHPFAPDDQTVGSRTLIARLAGWLGALTGLPAVCLQPNAGSQGEFAGLLAIRAWHRARGQAARDVCLIPASAHGTNPASAAMAGLRVVVVACDSFGNVDLADLRAKAARHADRLAALMVTYPSTHGVFEPAIRDVCAIVHAAGGQVYMDGANMNAQLGLTSPGAIGADVCHLNLHKTFCIPHGGGGPGVGPVCAASHLAAYLPGAAEGAPVAAAPFGSALILAISYAYIRLMGSAGLTRATQVAILSANYIAARLRPHYKVLFTGPSGMVAHECIIDCRGFAATTGVQVEDIAKRLQDYGFHAPTMSWPVPGTLMIEPTESEPKAELDRFCDAMIAIAGEIADIAAGRLDRADNPLKHAPHTARELAAAVWPHAYSRELAAFPLPFVAEAKFWPAVKRVDNVYGDRNLVCTCAPLESFAAAAE
jgi:glycine dehydrogenase